MAGEIRHSSPGGREPVDKVRRLQRRLWVAAKRSPERRFHALYDRIFRSDVLEEAWKRVRANRGAAGVDRETLAEVEAYGVERMLAELQDALRAGRYRPAPVRRQVIPKPDGGRRPLGIPTVRDRVVQQAAKLVLEPIFEADFRASSYGYRPRRTATQALERIRVAFPRGCVQIVGCDIRDFFGSIDHGRLLDAVRRRVSGRRVVKLVRLWLQAGVMEDGQFSATVSGTPQGGVISPLLANIYLHALDETWEQQGHRELVRYADDLVGLCRTEEEATAALEVMRTTLAAMGLELHPEKTRIRQKVRDRTGRNRNGVKDIRVLIRELNPILRGWGTYFRTGNAANKFRQVDRYVASRLRRFLVKRHGRNLHAGQANLWTEDWLHQQGLYRLRGTIRYPEAA